MQNQPLLTNIVTVYFLGVYRTNVSDRRTLHYNYIITPKQNEKQNTRLGNYYTIVCRLNKYSSSY